jgi:hypothetical protein
MALVEQLEDRHRDIREQDQVLMAIRELVCRLRVRLMEDHSLGTDRRRIRDSIIRRLRLHHPRHLHLLHLLHLLHPRNHVPSRSRSLRGRIPNPLPLPRGKMPAKKLGRRKKRRSVLTKLDGGGKKTRRRRTRLNVKLVPKQKRRSGRRCELGRRNNGSETLGNASLGNDRQKRRKRRREMLGNARLEKQKLGWSVRLEKQKLGGSVRLEKQKLGWSVRLGKQKLG